MNQGADQNCTKEFYDDNPYYKLHYTQDWHPQPSISPQLHYDASLVLTYFLKGRGNIRVEGQYYPVDSGDLIILNPHEIHVSEVEPVVHERISLYIYETILDRFQCTGHSFFDSFYKRPNGTNNVIPSNIVHAAGIDSQLQKILDLNRQNTIEGSVLAICAIIELLAMLNQTNRSLIQDNYVTSVTNKHIIAIMKYLAENYTKKISIDELAEKFHFNKHYLCRLFKECTGITILEYCTLKKILAFNQLVCQNYSLEDACYRVGFHNYSNFYRLYKKHTGMSPSEYKSRT